MRRRAAAVLLAAQIACAPAAGAGDAGRGTADTPPALTIKERLSGKASDDQRVNNCKVPVERRGPTPRPDDCRPGARSAPTH